MEKCRSALKLIRAEQNNVPKLKFLFTSTSLTTNTSIDDVNLLQTPMAMTANNVHFHLSSTTPEMVTPIRQLSSKTKELVKCLGMNSTTLYSKIRAKEVAAVLTNELVTTQSKINEIPSTSTSLSSTISNAPIPPKRPPKQYKDACVEVKINQSSISSQTDVYQCDSCLVRKQKLFVTKSTQIFQKKKMNSTTQTDEEDYREPVFELLSQLTAAQLIAVKDFTTIVMEPRPQNSVEMYKMRERMMDVYNLSQRDADAVRIAQQNRLDDPVSVERLRYRGDGTGDNYSGRDYDDEMNNSSGSNKVPSLGRNYDVGSSGNGRSQNSNFGLFGFREPEQNDYEHDELRQREFEIERRRAYEEKRRMTLIREQEDEEERRRLQAEHEEELRRKNEIEENRRRQNDQYYDDDRDRHSFHGSNKRGARGAFRNTQRTFRGRGGRGRM